MMQFQIPKLFVVVLLIIDLVLASGIIYVNLQSEIVQADENICEEGTKYEILPTYIMARWSAFPIPYDYDSSFPQAFRASFDLAVEEWNDATNRELFRRVPSINLAQLVIVMQTDEYFFETTLAYARGSDPTSTLFPTKSVINFNEFKDFGDLAFSCELFPLEYEGPYDLQSIAVHELGHILGLAHVNDEFATMHNYYKGSFGRTLSKGDLDGFRFLY